MIRLPTFAALSFALLSGLALYGVKYRTERLDRTIATTVRETEALRARTGILKAEWALLNDPDRLSDLALRHLALKPIDPRQFVSLDDLDRRLPPIRTEEEPAPAEVPLAAAAPAGAGPKGEEKAAVAALSAPPAALPAAPAAVPAAQTAPAAAPAGAAPPAAPPASPRVALAVRPPASPPLARSVPSRSAAPASGKSAMAGREEGERPHLPAAGVARSSSPSSSPSLSSPARGVRLVAAPAQASPVKAGVSSTPVSVSLLAARSLVQPVALATPPSQAATGAALPSSPPAPGGSLLGGHYGRAANAASP